MSSESQITFEPQPNGQFSPQCADITIVNDEVLETTEMFLIELQSTNPDVSTAPSANSAVVIIMDDDSMCRHMVHSPLSPFCNVCCRC